MLRKKEELSLLSNAALIAFTLGYLLKPAPLTIARQDVGATEPLKQAHASKIQPSSILRDLRSKKEHQPSIPPNELAEHANKLLEQKGFDYNFDVCEIAKANNLSVRTLDAPLSKKARPYRMTQTNGEEITFHIAANYIAEGICSECFFPIPALQVTKREILAIVEGKQYRLKRPTGFVLDEVSLVDENLRKVIRKWQLPYQTVPRGISEDGTKIYVGFYVEAGLDELVLEISATGRIQFKACKDVDLQDEGEWIENHPKELNNDYLAFKRFHVAGRSYIIKFDGPCS